MAEIVLKGNDGSEIVLRPPDAPSIVLDTSNASAPIILSGALVGPQGVKGDKGDTGATGQGVPTGGSTGQVLTKSTGTDFDTSWTTPPNALVTSVAGKTGDVLLSKSDVGLGNVDNTSDANKPVSTAQASADNLRVLKAGDTMTGSLILSNTAPSITHYNTADQVTNYERLTAGWSSNLYSLTTQQGGTGTARDISMASGARAFRIYNLGGSSTGFFNFSHQSTSLGTTALVGITGISNSTSGILSGLNINPTITQTGTAGYTALLINPTETSTGSGTRLLIDAQIGSSSRFSVSNTGGVSSVDLLVANQSSANQVAIGRTASGVPGAGITFGSALDTNIYRGGTDLLQTDDQFKVVAGATNTAWGITLSQGNGSGNTNSGRLFFANEGDAASTAFSMYRAGTALVINYGATPGSSSGASTIFALSPGGNLSVPITGAGAGITIGGDVQLYRSAANQLQIDDGVYINNSAGLAVNTAPNAAGLINLPTGTLATQNGILWGTDTVLYRSGAGVLQTDNSFNVGSGLGSTNLTVRANSFNGVATYVYSDTASAYSFFYRARGTISAPTAVTSGSFIGSFGWRSYDGSAFVNQDSARFSALATENVTSTAAGAALAFYTAPNGTIAAAERLRIDQSGNVRIGNTAAINSRLTFDATTTAAGGILWGSDTNLYRAGTDLLQTDDTFRAAGLRLPQSTKTANYTVVATDHTIFGDATAGTITITLPTASTVTDQIFVIKKIDSSTNFVTISGTIDGFGASTSISVQYNSVTLQSNGTQYYII